MAMHPIRGPVPYVNDVPSEPGKDPMMKTVPFNSLDIGARASGMPKGMDNGSMSVEHVGGSAGNKGT